MRYNQTVFQQYQNSLGAGAAYNAGLQDPMVIQFGNKISSGIGENLISADNIRKIIYLTLDKLGIGTAADIMTGIQRGVNTMAPIPLTGIDGRGMGVAYSGGSSKVGIASQIFDITNAARLMSNGQIRQSMNQGLNARTFGQVAESVLSKYKFGSGDVRRLQMSTNPAEFQKFIDAVSETQGGMSEAQRAHYGRVKSVLEATKGLDKGSAAWQTAVNNTLRGVSAADRQNTLLGVDQAYRGESVQLLKHTTAKDMTKTMAQVVEVTSQLKDIFQIDDFKQIEANMKALGYSTISTVKAAKDVKKHIHDARVIATQQGVGVDEVLADQASITQAMGATFGSIKNVSPDTVMSIQRAKFDAARNDNTYFDANTAAANKYRSIVNQAGLHKRFLVMRMWRRKMTGAGVGGEAMERMRELEERYMAATDPAEQEAIGSQMQTLFVEQGGQVGWFNNQHMTGAAGKEGADVLEQEYIKSSMSSYSRQLNESTSRLIGKTGAAKLTASMAKALQFTGAGGQKKLLEALASGDKERINEVISSFKASGMTDAEIEENLRPVMDNFALLDKDTAATIAQNALMISAGDASISNIRGKVAERQDSIASIMETLKQASGMNMPATSPMDFLNNFIKGVTEGQTFSMGDAASFAVLNAMAGVDGATPEEKRKNAANKLGGAFLGKFDGNSGLTKEAISALKNSSLGSLAAGYDLSDPTQVAAFLVKAQGEGYTIANGEHGMSLISTESAKEAMDQLQLKADALEGNQGALRDLFGGSLYYEGEELKFKDAEGNVGGLEDALFHVMQNSTKEKGREAAASIYRQGEADLAAGKDTAHARAVKRQQEHFAKGQRTKFASFLDAHKKDGKFKELFGHYATENGERVWKETGTIKLGDKTYTAANAEELLEALKNKDNYGTEDYKAIAARASDLFGAEFGKAMNAYASGIDEQDRYLATITAQEGSNPVTAILEFIRDIVMNGIRIKPN